MKNFRRLKSYLPVLVIFSLVFGTVILTKGFKMIGNAVALLETETVSIDGSPGGSNASNVFSNPGPCSKLNDQGPTYNCTAEDVQACMDHLKQLDPGACASKLVHYVWGMSGNFALWVSGDRDSSGNPRVNSEHPDFRRRVFLDVCSVRFAVSEWDPEVCADCPAQVELMSYTDDPPNRIGSVIEDDGRVTESGDCMGCHDGNYQNSNMGFGPQGTIASHFGAYGPNATGSVVESFVSNFLAAQHAGTDCGGNAQQVAEADEAVLQDPNVYIEAEDVAPITGSASDFIFDAFQPDDSYNPDESYDSANPDGAYDPYNSNDPYEGDDYDPM